MAALAALKELEDIEVFDSHSTFNTISENDYPAQRRRLLDALSYLERLEDDWTGRGAKKPTTSAISMAKHFVESLFLNKQHADYIEPDGDGGIIFKWQSEAGRILLNIDGTMMNMAVHLTDRAPFFIDDIKFFDPGEKILPEEILEHIPLLVHGCKKDR